MAYPFPSFPYPRATPQVIRPSEVDALESTAQCQALLNNSRDSAMLQAAAYNSPRYYDFAQSFDIYSNGDKAVIQNYANGETSLTYQGACDLLSTPETRETLWPFAREAIKQEIRRYYEPNTPAVQKPGVPTMVCSRNVDTAWTCRLSQ